MELIITSPENTEQVAKKFFSLFSQYKIFAFYGELGAGKTTFIKALCKEAGVTDIVSSPSFALVYEYQRENGENIYHFDFFRIKNQSELFDLGYEDYIYSGNICFIEWPEMAENLLPDETLKVRIVIQADGSRQLITDI